MRQGLSKVVAWLAGVLAVVAIIAYFRPENFAQTIAAVGLQGLAAWLALTLAARWLLVETTVMPLGVLGFAMKRADVFWVGWIRTLANFVLPMSGIAAYARVVRDRAGISWSELAALAAPQLVLALAALGVVGLGATACNAETLQGSSILFGILYLAVLVLAVVIATGAPWFVGLLPGALADRVARTTSALRKLATHPNLVVQVIVLHTAAIVLRGGRIWVLFAAAGFALDWRELLLVIAIAESTMLVNATPGGLGIREALVLGGSALVGVPASVAASVALVDRLFVIVTTALLSAPAFAYLRRPRG